MGAGREDKANSTWGTKESKPQEMRAQIIKNILMFYYYLQSMSPLCGKRGREWNHFRQKPRGERAEKTT